MRAMLRGVVIVVFATCATLATKGPTSYLRYPSNIFNFYNISKHSNDFRRFSTNVTEDGLLKVPQLINKYGYPQQVHTVTTVDGYILEMHRIPNGRTNATNETKPVVFLMHGFLSSSSVWVLMGPGRGLAYILADEGYDVWMGNARGNNYSRLHTKLNPNDAFNKDYWKFSLDEIGTFDVPTMIDYVLKQTKNTNLHYIGHSQGATSFFIMASLQPEYNQKIISMHALAPVVYMGNNQNTLLSYIAPYANHVRRIEAMFGYGEFYPYKHVMDYAGIKSCMEHVVYKPACSNIMFLMGGWNKAEFNKTLLPTIEGHLPAGASIRQFIHFAQGIQSREFRHFDHGLSIKNMKSYGIPYPRKYNLRKVTAPVHLYYSDSDPLAHVLDIDRLLRELGNPVKKYRVPLATFTHYDYVLGIHSKRLVYNTLIKTLAEFNEHDLEWYLNDK